jgi:hypothetical protein
MTENYFIGIYWEARQESVEECAMKIEQTLTLLSKEDKGFCFWYKTTKPKRGEIVEPLELTKRSIEVLLLEGRNYNDEGRLVEELGYQIHLKSGLDYNKSHNLSFTCGGYSKMSKLIPNNVNATIRASEIKNPLFDKKDIDTISELFKRIWNPERSVVRIDD